MSVEPAESSELTTAEAQQLGVQFSSPSGPRRVRLKHPRRWPKVKIAPGIVVLKCPYCLALIADPNDGDVHLWRRHAGNNRERAGEWDWEPWASDLELRVSRLERELADVESNGLERVYDEDQGPTKRRIINKIWCRYPAPPREGWQQ